MKTNPNKTLLLILVFLISYLLPMAVIAGGSLDGKVFTTLLDGENDVLTFENGTFHSSSCDEWGFNKGEYTVEEKGNSISFQATTTSENDGTLVWTGTIQGDTINGSYNWSKKGWFGTKTKTKTFEGSIKQ